MVPVIAASPDISVPTITLEGDANGAPHPEASAYATKFVGRYAHRLIEGGFRSTDVTHALFTHLHYDHCGCNAFFPRATLICHAREIARAVRFLTDDDAGYITGSVISVNGGLEM